MIELKEDTALVVLSGGQDSVTCLANAKAVFSQVHAVTFHYGQAHSVELESAKKAAGILGVESHEIIFMPEGILQSTSPLVSRSHALDTYEGVDALPDEGIEQTFVPMRNALFLTVAANRAVSLGAATIITGVSQEDFGGYPDCRSTFLEAQAAAINAAIMGLTDTPIILEAPLLYLDKRETVNLAVNLQEEYGLPVMEALAYSHTCYAGAVPPCGKCHACLLRQRGFEAAGVEDPLIQRLSIG